MKKTCYQLMILTTAAVLTCNFGFAEDESKDLYEGQRKLAMTVTAEDLELAEEPPFRTVMMESSSEDGVLTLISSADGSCSVYFSNGGGVIAACDKSPAARSAALKFRQTVEKNLKLLKPVKEYPRPNSGSTVLYANTAKGFLKLDPTKEISKAEDEYMTSVAEAGQALILEIHKVSEAG